MPSSTHLGFAYRADFLSSAEERALLADIEALTFHEVRMRGVTAKRTVAHFGWDYGYESWRIQPTQPLPAFVLPLRTRCAELAQVDATTLEQLLAARYPPGAGIGWHRDAPIFGPVVVGVSLLSACRMRFRRELAEGCERFSQVLAPRSAYVLSGAARSAWQHSIPPTSALRYSLTFRQVRRTVATPRSAC